MTVVTYPVVKKYPVNFPPFHEDTIWDDAQQAWDTNKGGALLKIHIMIIKDGDYKLNSTVENPKHDPDGTACVARVETAVGQSDWIFFGRCSSNMYMRDFCGANYGTFGAVGSLSSNPVFRAALLSSVEKHK